MLSDPMKFAAFFNGGDSCRGCVFDHLFDIGRKLCLVQLCRQTSLYSVMRPTEWAYMMERMSGSDVSDYCLSRLRKHARSRPVPHVYARVGPTNLNKASKRP